MSYLNYDRDNPKEFELIPYKLTSEMLRQLGLVQKKRISKKHLDDKTSYHLVKRAKGIATSIVGLYAVCNYFITEKMVQVTDKIFSTTNFSSLKAEEAVGVLGISAVIMFYAQLVSEFANMKLYSREDERLKRLHNEAFKIVKELDKKWRDEGNIAKDEVMPWCLRVEKNQGK